MLIINPAMTLFDGETMEQVRQITVDRETTEPVVEWTAGPHPIFADVRRLTTTLRLTQDLLDEASDDLRPPRRGVLSFVTSRGRTEGRTYACEAILLDVVHTRQANGSTRTLRFLCLSDDGLESPL